MISNKVKKFLSGVMIAGDILLGAVFFADLLAGMDVSMDLFLLAFLSADALLSLDYIGRLSKEEKEKELVEIRLKRAQNMRPDRKLDLEMADDISAETEALSYLEEMDPEELAELLQHREKEESYKQRR